MSLSPMVIASSMLGKREGPEHTALTEYLKNGGANLDPSTTAWCAAFVNSSLGQAGLKGTGSNLARSFLDYGEPTDKPQKGDIAVFSRGDPKGILGHVGFFDHVNPDGSVNILAGNQGNAVSYGNQPAANLLGYRHVGGGLGVDPQTTSGILGGHQSGGILGGIPQDAANEISATLGESEQQQHSPLQKLFAGLAQYPDAPAPRLGQMGDARSSGDALLKFVQSLKGGRS